jgi:galactonate dehydratase
VLINRRNFLCRATVAAAGVAAAPWLEAAKQSSATRLKVTGYKTVVVNNVRPYAGARHWLFVQLFTDQGLVGLGERPTGWAPNLKSQIELISDLCERHLVGQNPLDIEKLWYNVYTTPHDYRNPGLYATPALSAIEMACWDLVGKATGQPVYNLLGGKFHEKLRAYKYMDLAGILGKAPRLAGERAAEMVEHGITVCKLEPFLPVIGPRDFSLETIRHAAKIFGAIRDAVGDRMEIGIGTHGQFSTSGAIRVASMLEEFAPFFFEEPVPPENVDEMARVAAHTNIPIATGERLVTKYEFAEVLKKQAAQIIQLDVGQCGGILESKKIAAMSEAHYAMIAPHMFCGPVAAAAAVQLDVCCPNFLVQEYNSTSLHSEILKEPLLFEKGFITPPIAPGLGVELNEAVVRRQLAT